MDFGVSLITPSSKPMQGTIPNVISLPYENHKPFCIQGPSWRSLLKLMARLSATRIEPSVEAIAKVKGEMRLRVVSSFVKMHSTSSEWHTILYMTIDQPVPLNAPNAWKYRNGDSSVLPWSYALSSPPALLRDGADAPLAKFYTIPSVPGNLYPTLPISFPDLATYLASALECSRDGGHEGYPGLRRLAKLVDALYPDTRAGELGEDEERQGMRQKLKNLVGLGSKPARSRNAETYDLVTPFVPDDFGR